MLDLIHSDLRRFFRSRILYITIILCGFIGWFTAHEARQYGNSDDVFLLGLMMVQAGGFSLIIGSEFSCKAVRNKLIVGYTKVQIYFSVLAVTLIASLLTYTAYILPLLSLHEVVEKTGVTPSDVVEMFGCILAVNLTMNIITVAVSFVFSARAAISAILCLAATVGIAFAGVLAGHALSRPEFWLTHYDIEEYEKYKNEDFLRGKKATLVEWGEDGDGNTLYGYEVEEPYEGYIKRGTPKFYCYRAADLLCPYNMLSHIERESSDFLMIYDKWGYGEMNPEDQVYAAAKVWYDSPWDLGRRLTAYLCLSVFVTAAGCLIFRKRDMK